ncbi:MAG: GatB/YqeY domain-containing protein [Bacteroidetes bacterium]|nr:MAG: GatB/YqeY domain-containing protein [Bacteroidota bacterium]
MSLTEKIAGDLINSMKAKDKVVLEAIRAAKTAFTLARTEKRGDTVLSADEELKIIQKLVKQRRESATIYKEQNRPDLYEKEIAEAIVLEKYLPEKMSDEELLNILKVIIARVGAKSPADMGKVMGAATKELAGKADGKEISAKVKLLLGI